MKKSILITFFFILVVSSFFVSALEQKEVASETDWVTSSGIEIDNIVTMAASLMALALFALTFAAFRRDGRKRLLYVAVAFFLFAVKGVLLTSDIFFPQKAGWVDFTASLLDFAILLIFFAGILKK